jgi:osmoprotectant transport system ATP-binding protein
MPEHAAIAFEDVSKRFGDAAPALAGVSFTVKPREFLVIVGASGSGKTTLLQLINRLSEPTAGRLRIGGVEAQTLDPTVLRRRIGYVFQEVGLFPHMTVAENIAITPKLLDWDETRRSARVDELLDLVRLDRAKHSSRFPAELSGGEGQRVGVARAIAAEPKIVLMDEPFGALDPLTRDALGEDYRALHDKLGLTSVMITHDMLEALLLADRIAVIRGGRIVAEGTPQALMSGEQDDYVRELMATPRRQAERLRKLSES